MAAIEFAIVLPVLVLLVFGIIEFSLLYYNKQVITNASREGARVGIALSYEGVSVTDSTVKGVIDTYCNNRLIVFGNASKDPTYPEPIGVGGSFPTYVTVTVNFAYQFLLPSLFGINAPMNLSATTVMQNM